MKTINLKEFLGFIKSSESQIDIQNTKEVIELGAAVAVALHKAWEDKSIDLSDIRHGFGVVGKINPAFKDIKQVKYEMSDLQDFEAKELTSVALKELEDLTGEQAKELILGWLNLGLEISSTVQMTAAYYKR